MKNKLRWTYRDWFWCILVLSVASSWYLDYDYAERYDLRYRIPTIQERIFDSIKAQNEKRTEEDKER